MRWRRHRKRSIVLALVLSVLLLSLLVCTYLLTVVPRAELHRQLSLHLKHAPLCFLENAGVLPARRAHFVNERGTIDVRYCTPAQSPRPSGQAFAHALLVVSDFGMTVQRFSPSGEQQWQRKLKIPRGVDVRGQTVYVAEEMDIVVLAASSGQELRRFRLPDYVRAIKVYSGGMLVAFDRAGPDAVALYRESGTALIRIGSVPHAFAYPRGLEAVDGFIYVADTFGHRIVKLDAATFGILHEAPSFYPNSVQIVGDRLLVAEEHLDLVTEFSAHDLGIGAVVAGCPDASASAGPPAVRQSRSAAGAGACAAGRGSPAALFSPNDARRAGPYVYVADTDHHRIVAFKDGLYWGQLTDFNNPVSLRVLAQGE